MAGYVVDLWDKKLLKKHYKYIIIEEKSFKSNIQNTGNQI